MEVVGKTETQRAPVVEFYKPLTCLCANVQMFVCKCLLTCLLTCLCAYVQMFVCICLLTCLCANVLGETQRPSNSRGSGRQSQREYSAHPSYSAEANKFDPHFTTTKAAVDHEAVGLALEEDLYRTANPQVCVVPKPMEESFFCYAMQLIKPCPALI